MHTNNKLNAYITELKKYNETTNIYSKSAYDHLDFHIANSLLIAKIIPPDTKTIFDLGSGSGLPAIPLSITLSSTRFTAIESKTKKTRFLSHVKQELRLGNLTVVTADANEFLRHTITPDVFTAKAFAPFDKIIKIIGPSIQKKCLLVVPISEKQKVEFSYTVKPNDFVQSIEFIEIDAQPFLRASLSNLSASNRKR